MPVVRSGAEIDYTPFSILHGDGFADGFAVELMRAALAKMGQEVTFRTGPWHEVQGWLEHGEIDALPRVGRTPEREALFEFTVRYMTMHGAIVVREDTTDVHTLADLRGRRVGVMLGDNAEEYLRREERGMELVTTPTITEAFRALAEGRCDAVVVQRLVAIRLLEESGLDNLNIVERPIHDFAQEFCFAVKAGDRDTLALLNEGLALVVADGTHRRLHAKWFAHLELPSDRPLIIGGDHAFPPFEFLDEKGRPAGFAVELTQAIAREMNLDIRIRLGPWAATVEALEAGDLHAIQGMFYTPERGRRLAFSAHYLAANYVGVARAGSGAPPETLGELTGLTVAVQAGDAIVEALADLGNDTQVLTFETQEDVLRAVLDGRVDCGLAVRLTTLYLARKNGWNELQLGKKPFHVGEYCYAVPQGQDALLARFSEGLQILKNSGEYQRLQDKWMGVHDEHFHWADAIKYIGLIAGPLLLIALLALFWSWYLRRQVAARTRELRAKETFFRAVLDNLPVGVAVNSVEPGVTFEYMNDRFVKIYRTTREALSVPNAFWEVVYPDSQFREELRARVLADCASGDPARMVWTDVPVARPGEPTTYIVAGNTPIPDTPHMISSVWDVTKRKLAEERLRQRLAYEQVLARVSAMAAQADELDAFLGDTLTSVGEMLDVSRAYLFAYHEDTDTLDNNHEWCAAGIFPHIQKFQGIPASKHPWWMETLRAGKAIAFADVGLIPAPETKDFLQTQDILSVLAVPLFVDGLYHGFIGFDECRQPREWPKEDIELIETISRIIASVMQREQAEEQLAAQYRLLRVAGETTRFGGWSVDLITNTCTWSDIVAEIHGMPNGFSPTAEEAMAFYAPEWRDKIRLVFAACAERGIPYDEEMEIVTPSGKRVWVRAAGEAIPDKDGRIIQVQGSFQDISTWKAGEEALRSSEQMYRLLAENTLDVIWIMTMDARFSYVNLAIEAVFGYTPADWIGTGLWEHCDESCFAEMKALIEYEVVKGPGRPGVIFETEMRQRDGSTIAVEIHGRVVFDEQGVPVSLQGVTRDITERKQQETRLVHIVQILRAIRNVNQLITKVDDPQGLIDGACANLTETLTYHNAWIALFDESATVSAMAHSGLDSDFDSLRDQLHRGEYTDCMRRALDVDRTVVITNVSSECTNCPLANGYSNRAGLARRLTFGGKTYGILTASVPPDCANDDEAHALFDEVADDLAFALHKIEAAELARRDQARMHFVIEGGGLGIWEWNVQTNETVFNETWATMLGYTLKELTPYDHGTWRRLVHPEDIVRATNALMSCVDGKTPNYSCELRMRHKDGRWVWILDSGRVMTHDKSGNPLSMFGTHTDITKIKEREERIVLFGDMLDDAPAAIVIHDIDGNFLYSNRQNIHLHGYTSEEEFLSVNLHQLDVPESNALQAERIRRIADCGEARFEVEHFRKDGSIFPLEVTAKTIDWHGQPAVLSIAIDITERKLAEQALERSRTELQAVYDATPVMLCVVDAERRVLNANHAFASFVGKSEAAVQSGNACKVLGCVAALECSGGRCAEWTDCSLLRELDDTLATGTAHSDIERHLTIERDGSRRDVVLLGATAPVHGDRRSVLLCLADITEKRALEVQLQQAQKMDAVGRLAGGVAHDFNNMLTIILGQAQLLAMKLADDDPSCKRVAAIEEAARRSTALTRQLLAFARKETIAPVPLDLNDAVGELLKMLRRLIGEDIDLSWQPGPNPWQVRMDPSQVDQLLVNLCVNARDAIDGVGKITIETENVSIDEEYCQSHVEAKPGHYVMLAVSDDGCGMDRETIAHIFEPFFTTKAVGRGTGLGLATVYGIVKQNEGFVNVYSELEKGTTFRLYLPRLADTESRHDQRQSPEACPHGNETVLLVEDEPAVRTIAQAFLEACGYRVLEADCPAAALELAAAHLEPIHLLLTDVVMPGMNGRDLAERLAVDRPDMRVLYMSGYTANTIAHRGVLEKDVHFIGKPFTREELARKVREVLG